MSEPTVCCVMLVNGREAMVRRAVASFRSQTYKNKRLLLWNTHPQDGDSPHSHESDEAVVAWCPSGASQSIGKLRNRANAQTDPLLGINADIIAHFDSDDWSHPNRLAEQVALLQASGADCVGYNQAVFWDERIIPPMKLGDGTQMGYPINAYEAWIYTSMVPKGILGASMLYWRSAWERKPFLDRRTGEDDRWLSGMRVAGVSAIIESDEYANWRSCEPRFIASVHGGNTSRVNPCEGPREWRRAPELDAYCKEKMQL